MSILTQNTAMTQQYSAPPLDHRLAMLRNGYRPVPVKTGTKAPGMAAWPDLAANATPESVATWPADHGSTGILCGAVRGLDIDVLDAKSANAIELLAYDTFGMSPLRREGRRPKVLLIYRADDATAGKRTSAAFTFPGMFKPGTQTLEQHRVEVLGAGQQAVSFGIHPDTGRPYSWAGVTPEDVPLTDLPVMTEAEVTEFLAAAERILEAAGGQRTGGGTTTRTGERQSARRAPPSIQAVVDLFDALPNPLHTTRDHWNTAGLAAAGCVHDTDGDMHGPIAEAFIGWAERGDETNEPTREKWDTDWSQQPAHSVHAGYDTLLRIARELDPAFREPAAGAEFEPLPALPTPEPARRRALFVSRDFQVSPNESYVIKHLVAPGNVCVLLGQPGAGKSTLAPHLAYAVAQGRRVFGVRTTAGRALYIAAEDLRGVEKRIGALGMRHGHTDDCAVMGCGNLRDPGECAAVFATVAEFKPALIVVDTVAAAFAGMDENTSQDMGQVVQFARRLAATGAAVVLVHHPAKSGDGSPRGHGSLNGTLDMTLTLAPDDVHDPDTIVRGQTPKNRNGTTARDFAFRKEVITLGVDSDGDPITTTLPVELDTADGTVAKPVKLSRAEAAAMGALHSLLGNAGADQVSEGEWLEACAALSTAEKPRDRLRSARNIRAGLVEKGAVCVANGLVAAVMADPGMAGGGINMGSTQGIEFIDGIKWDQAGITLGSKPGNVGWMGSTPKGDPIPSHAPPAELERTSDRVPGASLKLVEGAGR